MAGVLVDINILYQFIEAYLPEIHEKIGSISKIQSFNFADFFKNILLKWFISIYIQNTTEKVF